MNTRARVTAGRPLALLTAAGVLLPAVAAAAVTGFGTPAASTSGAATSARATGSAATSTTASTTTSTTASAARAGTQAALAAGPLAKARAAAAGVTAKSAPAEADETPAVFGPLLGFFRFGAAIGAPLVCQAVTSGMGSGAEELGLAEQASPVVGAINDGCDTFAVQGTAAVDMFSEAAKPAVALNPYLNPVLEQGAVAFETYGEQYGKELAPFGPTIAGLSADARWLEGK